MPGAGLFLGHTKRETEEGMCCSCQEGYECICVAGLDHEYVSVNMGQYK